ncbi:MAG: hypothetical protein WDN31_21280 [Hyphomicrobium sp.]
MAAPVDTNPVASAVRTKLNGLPTEGSALEIKERAVLSDFYAARRDTPIWLSEGGLTEKGAALGAEILKAEDWGLDQRDFALPMVPPAAQLTSESIGKTDVEISPRRPEICPICPRRPHHRPGDPSQLQSRPQAAAPRSRAGFQGNRRRARSGGISALPAPQAAAVREAAPSLSRQQGQAPRQEDPRQHGRVALDARRPRAGAYPRQRPRVHGLFLQGRRAHP